MTAADASTLHSSLERGAVTGAAPFRCCRGLSTTVGAKGVG